MSRSHVLGSLTYENDESADRGIVEQRKCGSRCDSSGSQQRSCRETMLQLHFTNDTLPDNVSADFQNLIKFSEQVGMQYAASGKWEL